MSKSVVQVPKWISFRRSGKLTNTTIPSSFSPPTPSNYLQGLSQAGEGRCLPVAIIKRLFKEVDPHTNLNIMYDIGCSPDKFIKSLSYSIHSRSSLLSRNHRLNALHHRSTFHNMMGLEKLSKYISYAYSHLKSIFLTDFSMLVRTLKQKEETLKEKISKSALFKAAVELQAETQPLWASKELGERVGTRLKEKIYAAIKRRKPAGPQNQDFDYSNFMKMGLDDPFWNDGFLCLFRDPGPLIQWCVQVSMQCLAMVCALLGIITSEEAGDFIYK
ncbi:hypothetical protein VP01_1106g2 [Puccinia sorghi]|uniref:Uncharacterized protein n=1 Tax=Puccinia sorghi TaxID=27349 RepID=A0A0L6VSS1_9BASI|nr:hypothetical protein VP01_1106g2 [Puccinia sorghi]